MVHKLYLIDKYLLSIITGDANIVNLLLYLFLYAYNITMENFEWHNIKIDMRNNGAYF
jgi:hypothetical protein